MFVFSKSQLKNFLHLPDEWSCTDKKILDLGAGDGGVTKIMAHFYTNVYATETSQVMQWRLKQLKFKILDIEKWKDSGPYDLISTLNLLDRHYDPKKLLRELHELAYRSSCLVLLAIVLPVSQYVEFNLQNSSNTYPDNYIPITGAIFEEQVNSLIKNVFKPANFETIRWTKLPYLCEGDSVRAYYKLDDAVFLLNPKRIEGGAEELHPLESQHIYHEHDTL